MPVEYEDAFSEILLDIRLQEKLRRESGIAKIGLLLNAGDINPYPKLVVVREILDECKDIILKLDNTRFGIEEEEIRKMMAKAWGVLHGKCSYQSMMGNARIYMERIENLRLEKEIERQKLQRRRFLKQKLDEVHRAF